MHTSPAPFSLIVTPRTMTSLLDLPPELLERICHLAVCYADLWGAGDDRYFLVKWLPYHEPNRKTLNNIRLTCRTLRDTVPDEVGQPSRVILDDLSRKDIRDLAYGNKGCRIEVLVMHTAAVKSAEWIEMLPRPHELKELSILATYGDAPDDAGFPFTALFDTLAHLSQLRHLQLCISLNAMDTKHAVEALTQAANAGLRLHTLQLLSDESYEAPLISLEPHKHLRSLSLWLGLFTRVDQLVGTLESVPDSLCELHLAVNPSRLLPTLALLPSKIREQLVRLSVDADVLDVTGLETFAKLEQADFQDSRLRQWSRASLPPGVRTMRVRLDCEEQLEVLEDLQGHPSLEHVSLPEDSPYGRSAILLKEDGRSLKIGLEEPDESGDPTTSSFNPNLLRIDDFLYSEARFR